MEIVIVVLALVTAPIWLPILLTFAWCLLSLPFLLLRAAVGVVLAPFELGGALYHYARESAKPWKYRRQGTARRRKP